jgi:hypothetical protein
MRSSYRKAALLGAVVALLSAVVVADDASASWDTNPLSTVVTNQHYLCGKDDLPEGPIQGDVPKADQDSGRAQQGYNCGLALVGHTRLDFDGRPNSNANMAIDISGLWDDDPSTGVAYLGNIQDAMDGPPVAIGPTADLDDALPEQVRSQTHPQNASHEAWPSADNKTLYAGGQTPTFELFSIVDISQWLERNPDGTPKGKPRVISQESGRGHSVRTATIGGEPYALHSEESVFGLAYGCIPQEAGPVAGAAQPWLTDIGDPAHPKTVSQFGLEINDPANCPEQLAAQENDSVHYHDVDDPADTTFVMASMWNAGLRVFDVRDPKNPTEVAYFNPADVDPSPSTKLDHAWGHIRYVAKTGQIWFASADGGFWVVRIEGKVRDYLQLDAKNVKHGLPALHVSSRDPGRAATIGAGLVRPAGGYLDITPYYCTLGSATGAAAPLPPG